MVTDEPAKNEIAKTEDIHDNFLDPAPIDSTSGLKHPDQCPEPWHICRDFLDPMADELEEWLRTSKRTVKGVRNLTYCIIAIVRGIGSDAAIADWRRAGAWLDVHGPVGFRGRFVCKTRNVWRAAEALMRKLPNLRSYDGFPCRGVEFQSFQVTVVEPFIADLRNWSGELKAQFPPGPPPAPVVDAAEHERRLRDLVATYDANQTRPTVADKGIGHILQAGHTCERLIVELLQDLFTWKDEHKLDESAVAEKFQGLRAASEEADGLTKNEGNVLKLTSGGVFSLPGQHWQSGHECLFHVARTMAADFGDGTKLQESLENHFLLRTAADWSKLFAQVQRERSIAESGNEVMLHPMVLFQAVQQVRPEDRPTAALDGRFPEGSPRAKMSRAAKKGAETKAADKATKVKEEQEKEERQRANQPKKPETKDWLAWALSTGKIDIIPAGEKSFRIVWPKKATKLGQADIAGKLSFVLETKVAQQRIVDMARKVEIWGAADLPQPDFAQWVNDPRPGEFTFKELTQLIDSKRQIFRPPPTH